MERSLFWAGGVFAMVATNGMPFWSSVLVSLGIWIAASILAEVFK